MSLLHASLCLSLFDVILCIRKIHILSSVHAARILKTGSATFMLLFVSSIFWLPFGLLILNRGSITVCLLSAALHCCSFNFFSITTHAHGGGLLRLVAHFTKRGIPFGRRRQTFFPNGKLKRAHSRMLTKRGIPFDLSQSLGLGR